MPLTLKPGVPHPGLLPMVISVKPAPPLEYINGFKNPNGGNPFERRASFSRLTIPAKVGEDADVPPISPDSP